MLNVIELHSTNGLRSKLKLSKKIFNSDMRKGVRN